MMRESPARVYTRLICTLEKKVFFYALGTGVWETVLRFPHQGAGL